MQDVITPHDGGGEQRLAHPGDGKHAGWSRPVQEKHILAPPYATRCGSLKLCVGVATTGRAKVLSAVLPHFAAQIRPPDALVVSAADPSDLDCDLVSRLPFRIEVIYGPKGSCAQRNRVLEGATDADVVAFFDDDFLVGSDYLAHAEALFLAMPDVVVATGRVIVDGALGPGLSVANGFAALEDDPNPAENGIQETYGAYGCNMLVRADVARKHGVCFDERLPDYGWLEDIDFSRQMARHGRIVRAFNLRGVHLGSKTSRSSGLRLGYSQIANPLYLIRKGTVSWRFASRYMMRNFASNLVKSLWPEPWVDRRGRLAGNLLALRDAATGSLAPERIKSL